MSVWLTTAVTYVLIGVCVFVGLSLERQIVRKPGRKIDFRRSPVLFRWNRWDTMTIGIGGYAVLNVLALFFLIASDYTFGHPLVRFCAVQAMAWSIVAFVYFVTRISLLLKGIKERWPDDLQ